MEIKSVPNKNFLKAVLASKIAVVLILALFVFPLSAFEAHVVNVTAVIENRVSCDALSVGYWGNHEGCQKGDGSSDWTSEINILSSSNFFNVFGSYSGEQICESLWTPNCPGGNSYEARLCKAKSMALGNELNVVSGRLDLGALIAGADDGDPAFDNLGVGVTSTVNSALAIIEMVLADDSSSPDILRDAAYVGERIYTFYEDENPRYPACIFDAGDFDTMGFNSAAKGLMVSIEPPEGLITAVDGNVVLNEILHNPEGMDDGSGLKGEWVELYNNEDFPVDVNDWFIEPFSAPGNRQVIGIINTQSGSTIIPAKGWMVVFMDGQVLSNFGETISLFNAVGEMKDEVQVGPKLDDSDNLENSTPGVRNTFDQGEATTTLSQSPTSTATSTPDSSEEEAPPLEVVPDDEGKSTARIPDGVGDWVDLIPTPGGPNKLAESEELPVAEARDDLGVETVTANVIETIAGLIDGDASPSSPEGGDSALSGEDSGIQENQSDEGDLPPVDDKGDNSALPEEEVSDPELSAEEEVSANEPESEPGLFSQVIEGLLGGDEIQGGQDVEEGGEVLTDETGENSALSPEDEGQADLPIEGETENVSSDEVQEEPAQEEPIAEEGPPADPPLSLENDSPEDAATGEVLPEEAEQPEEIPAPGGAEETGGDGEMATE